MLLLLRTSLLVLVGGLLARPAVQPLAEVARGGAQRFDELLQAALGAALLACLVWLVLGAALTASGELLARTRPASAAARLCTAAAERVTPALVRRVVTAGLGVAVTGGALTATASADPGEHHPTGSPAAGVLSGLPLPDRTVGAAPSADGPRTQSSPATRTASRAVPVRPGDSLWSIAAARLPDDAPTGRVAAATRALYDANAERIGADPDLIHPGTTLHLPPSVPPAHPDREDRR